MRSNIEDGRTIDRLLRIKTRASKRGPCLKSIGKGRSRQIGRESTVRNKSTRGKISACRVFLPYKGEPDEAGCNIHAEQGRRLLNCRISTKNKD